MKQLHHPKDSRTYTKGANFDVDKEFLTLSDGQYLDARNMRNLSMDGTNGALKKIGGMESLYPNINNNCIDGDNAPMASTYTCIGATVVNGNIVEFWADTDEVLPSYIRINGKIGLMHPDFPITHDHPLQMDVNESCVGGEIYITDFNVEPMIFNIQDILENGGFPIAGGVGVYMCTEKYFADFNISLYTLSLNRALNHPVFVKLDAGTGGYSDILSGNGLPVGYVSYSFRYATDAGDRTSWSAPTDLIPVVSRLTNGSEPNFPHLQTHSKPADISIPSVYGAHIKIRVDNVAEYDFIELRRDFWYAENPIGNPPVVEIVAKIDVASGELSVRDILDQGKEAEEIVSGDELIEVIASIRRAKAIRYFNQTLYLMNVEYDSRDIANTLTYTNGNEMYPCIENMGVRGHGEPHNAAKYKSIMRGERNGWAVILWDSQGGYSFADKIPNFEDYQMPNRRDATSSFTEDVSYLGTARAATVSGTVDQTHEVFDLVGATKKEDYCSYKNIYQDRGGSSSGTTKPTAPTALSQGIDYNSPPCPTAADEGLEDPAGQVDADNLFWRPFTPTSQSDTDNDCLDYVVNNLVENSGAPVDYSPKAFSPRYFSMGMALDSIGGFPEWAKAFSIVKTVRADRVQAQGLGFYSMNKADGAGNPNTSKNVFELWLYLPDADDNHGINNNLVDAIQSDPSGFGVQLVSPLGFFTEVYSFDDDAARDKAADLVTWCRYYNDRAGASAEINPDENPNMGILDGVTGDRFVAYGKWRASTQYSPQHAAGGNGNFVYDIDSITEVTSGRAKYLVLRTTQQIYEEQFWGNNSNGDDPDVQDWHEPVYMVNVIKKNAVVPSNNTTQYKYTGNYVKLESLIGVSSFTDSENFELVDERWEDCIQSLNDTNGLSTFDGYWRFCWIEDSGGNKRRWWNITDASPAQITAALIDLEANGFHDVTDPSGTYTIYGVYRSTETLDNAYKEFVLNFDYFDVAYSKQYQVPPLGESVYVLYDNRIPVRVFGGDTFIGDTTCAWLDNEYDDGGNPIDASNEWRLNVAFPYRRYHLNPRIFIVKRANDSVLANIQQQDKFKFSNALGDEKSEIRQLVSNFIVESRICLNYAFNNENPLHSSEQWFPLKNYIMRPTRWSESQFSTGDTFAIYDDNNMHEDYETRYGDEWLLWQYGGFRFINLQTSVPLINLDYSQSDNTRQFTSTPELGFEEETHYCTRVHWSVRRPTNIQDSATVRTFPSGNVYDISDDTGEIKFAFSAISGKGNNLYAFTEGGVCLLLVDKRIIHEINADELATVGSDVGGVLNELWITKNIGMSDETWRSAAEYDNKIWFVNHKSAYVFEDNQISDIGRTGYHSKLYPYYLQNIGLGYNTKLTSVYDELHGEYWINFSGHSAPEGVIDSPTLVFGNIQGMWIGGFDYDFEQYVTIDNDTYGIKNSGTYLLNQGNQIDGSDIISELVNASVGDVAYEDRAPVDNRYMDKEFLRIRVNSNFEPTSVEFFNDFDQYIAGNVQANIDNVANPLAMKDYFGHEGWIPRKTNPPRRRMQGRLLIYNIINIFDEGFKITTTDIQYKKLK